MPYNSKPPRNVYRAAQFITLNLILLVLINVLIFTTHEVTLLNPKTYFQYSNAKLLLETIARIAIIITLITYILKGRNWARIAYVAYIALHQLLHLTTHSNHFSSAAVLALALVYFALEIASLIMLFTPSSNRWFHRN